MYNSLRRRRGSNQSADACARQVPADFHVGSYRDFLRRHKCESASAARGTRNERTAFAACLFRRVADSRNLKNAIDHLRAHGGPAPGPDELCLRDLEVSEQWELARALKQAILTGRYRPGAEREVQVPKGSGRGFRTLRIQNAQDRIVQRAIVQIVQPLLDPTFAANSYGFRPRRSREQALAKAESLTRARGCWIFDDIKDAFDQVPHARLVDVWRQRLPADDLLKLFRLVIQNETGRGLRQGSALSPLALNLYLDHHLDRPWKKQHRGNMPLLRYADDLLVLALNDTQAQEAYGELRERLQSAGMPLKGNPQTAIRDLASGQTGEWLGFSVRKAGRDLVIQLTEKCWSRLGDALALAHMEPGSPIRAIESIEGWIAQAGPCCAHQVGGEVLARIVRMARALAFEEVPTVREFRRQWTTAHERWVRTRGTTTTTTVIA